MLACGEWMTYKGLDEIEVWFVHEVHFAEGRSRETVEEVSAWGLVLLVQIYEEAYGHHDEKEGQASKAEVLYGSGVNVMNEIREIGLAWVKVVSGGNERGRAWDKGDILPEGVEAGLCAEVFCLLARGEHGVDALAHGVVWEPRVWKCLAEFVDLWGESGRGVLGHL